MKLYQLKYFKIIAKYENIRKASEDLYISESALSKALKSLEEELTVPLFDRVKKRIYLNATGKMVLEYTDVILNATEKIKQNIEQIKNEQQAISIFSTSTLGLRGFLPIYINARQNYFIYNELINHKNVVTALQNNKVDMVVVSNPIEEPGISCLKLCDDHLMMAVPNQHPLFHNITLTVEDLHNQKVLRLKGVSEGSSELNKRYRKKRIHFNYFWVYDYSVYDAMLMSSKYLTPTSHIGKEYFNPAAKQRYRFIEIEGEEMKIGYYICALDNQIEMAKDFKKTVLQHLNI